MFGHVKAPFGLCVLILVHGVVRQEVTSGLFASVKAPFGIMYWF